MNSLHTLNKEKDSSSTSYQKKFATFLVFADLVYSLATWFLLNFYAVEPSFERIVVFCSRFAVNISVWGFTKFRSPWNEKLLGLLFIVIFIGNLFDKLLGGKFCDKRLLFDLGLTISYQISFVSASKMSPRLSMIIIALMAFTLVAAVPPFLSDDAFTVYIIPGSLTYSFVVLTLCLLKATSENELNSSGSNRKGGSDHILKALLKDVLPWSIVIATEERILYANSSASKIFTSPNKESVWDNIKEIKLWEKNSEFRAYKQDKYLSPSPCVHRGRKKHWSPEAPRSKREKKKSLCNLKELISGKEKYELGDNTGLLTFYGSFSAESKAEKEEAEKFHISGLSNSFEKKFFEITTTDIEWEGVSAKLIIFCEDDMIRKLKLLQRQSKFKDQLLATVGHNLRTPLNGIFGMLSSLNVARTPENLDLNKSLKFTKRFAEILFHTIKDIENYNKFIFGKLEVDCEPFSLSEKIEAIIKLYRFQAKRKGVVLKFENKISEHDIESDVVQNDYSMFQQVVFNLVSNAIKFTNKGIIKVFLEYRPSQHFTESDPCGALKVFNVRVEDTGMGMKPEQRERLFKLFGQTAFRRARQPHQPLNGIGLGLTMSQIIVKMMNDQLPGLEIKLQSEYGQGSSFEFPIISKQLPSEKPEKGTVLESPRNEDYLEVRRSESSLIPFEAASEDFNDNISERQRGLPLESWRLSISENPWAKGKKDQTRVLLVDDDQINIIVGENYLKQLGFHNNYDVALNGDQACEKVKALASQNQHYTFLLMDCNMPVMDGFEASLKIQEIHKKHNFPKPVIIASTANHSQEDLARINDCGMAGYLIKPYKKQDLKEMLDKLLG